MARKFAYLTMTGIILVFLDWRINQRTRICVLLVDKLTISTVVTGIFSETIPQTGIVTESGKVAVEIDELYLSRITLGLKATSTLDNAEILFRISEVDTALIHQRFRVLMDLTDTAVTLPKDKSVRLRIRLSEPREEIIVPVGGFYKDTGGKWIYVKSGEDKFVKRAIRLGAKNPEYFVVLDGLIPGEEVLTSTYQNFPDKNTLSLSEVRRRKPVSMM